MKALNSSLAQSSCSSRASSSSPPSALPSGHTLYVIQTANDGSKQFDVATVKTTGDLELRLPPQPKRVSRQTIVTTTPSMDIHHMMQHSL